MPATRRSARLGSSQETSPSQPTESPKATAGSKRKPEPASPPAPKRGRKDAPKEQKTIEESMDIDQPEGSEKAVAPNQKTKTSQGTSSQPLEPHEAAVKPKGGEEKQDTPGDEQPQHNGQDKHEPTDDGNAQHAAPSSKGADSAPPQDAATNPTPADADTHSGEDKAAPPSAESQAGQAQKVADGKQQSSVKDESKPNGDSAIEPHARDDDTPSSILEKGIIYFFIRGRVGIDNPSEVGDIARSFIILRPIPHGAKLGDGPITASQGKCRLLALPKKVLPLSGRDKFMTFVEKARTSFAELKKEFLPASDYPTQTAGVRHTPAATPVAEGVYAITTTGRESHLAYMTTIPSEIGEVQKDMGIRSQGSFVTSVRNPKYSAPAYATLPESPDFSQDLMDKFRNLRWAPLEPGFLDAENCQFLLIGESSGLDAATQPQDGDEKKADPLEEMEKLEGEDEIRVKHLQGNDAIFADLGVSKKDYPSLQTTWET